MNDKLQLLVAAVIVGLVLYSFFRHGRSNPENTGKLAKRMGEIEKTIGRQDERMRAMEGSIERLTQSTATSDDIAGLREMIAGDRAINDRTWAAVSRLQDFFVDKAINGGRR